MFLKADDDGIQHIQVLNKMNGELKQLFTVQNQRPGKVLMQSINNDWVAMAIK